MSNRLEKLKQSKTIAHFPRLLKIGVGSWLYSIITIALVCIILTIGFFNSVSNSVQHVEEKQLNWQEVISNFYELNKLDRTQALAQIRSEMVESVSDVSGYFLLKPIIESDINTVVNISQQWLNEFEVFRDYRLSAKGITNVRNSQRAFTDDLSDFLLRNRSLFLKTTETWQNLWFYRSLLQFSGKKKILTIINFIEKILPKISEIFTHPESILDLLGDKKPQKFVIFNQNTAEARPTGGFIGSHIPIDISKGRVTIGQSQSIYWVQGSHTQPRIASPFLTNYAMMWGTNYTLGGVFDTVNFPCFPTSAAFLQREFAESTTGYNIDHLAMITPEVLTQLLPSNFEFAVPNIGTLKSSEFLSEIDRITALEYDNPQNPKEALTAIFDALLNKLPDILSSYGSLELLNKVANLVFTRDIQMWSATEKTQKLFSQFDAAGEKTCVSSPQNSKKTILSPILFNISGDKRNAITTNSWSLNSQPVLGGQKVTLQYKQIIENTEKIPRNSFNKDLSFTFVGLQIPNNARHLDVYSPQALQRTFKPDFYIQNIEEKVDTFKSAPEIQLLWDSGKDLSPNANPPGFEYMQPDGSKVLGIYISDDMVSNVTFEFVLPVAAPHSVFFVPQVGLRKPLLSLGSGAYFLNYQNDRVMNNRNKLSGGVDIILN